MKKNVTWYNFRQAFEDYDRLDNFSIQGLEALYEWLIEYEEELGEEIELDVIALCCEFSEYESAVEAAEYYGYNFEDIEDDDDKETEALEQLENQTIVIDFPGGVIIQGY